MKLSRPPQRLSLQVIMLAGIIALLLGLIVSTFVEQSHTGKHEQYEAYLQKEYDKIPDDLRSNEDGEPAPDHPGHAAIQEYFMTLDPALGRVPAERRKTAYQQTQSIRAKQLKSSNRESLQWGGTGAEMGGRTRCALWDPNDQAGNKVWAGGVTGGLWYNNDITNDNSEWMPVNDFWDNLSISSIAYDPNNTNTFYVGTGEVETALVTYRESSGRGVGIWKSTDQGESWELLESTEDFAYVTDIIVRDENGSSVIYAGVASGEYKGANHQSEPSDGLYRSTDGGQSWEQVLPDITDLEVPYAVSDLDTTSNGRIFVGSRPNIEGKGGATILYSDEGTAGSWTVFEEYRIIIEGGSQYYLPGRVKMAAAPSDANVVYAVIAAGYISGHPYYHGRYILRTDNAGDNWYETGKPNAGDWASLAWHALAAAVDPNDPDELYVGGLDVWKTTDAGNTWSHLSDWSLMYYGGGPDYVHADQHEIVYKPGSSEEILFTSDGGVFYTSNGTSYDPTFEEKNNGYNTLQFYTCDIDPESTSNHFVGGLQDNGTLLHTGQPLDINDMIDGGDGAFCFFDEDDPEIMLTSVYYNRYSVFVNGNEVNYLGYYSGLFINPADLDSYGNTLYANAVGFFGEDPEEILRVSGLPYNEDGDFIDLNTGTGGTPFTAVKVSPNPALGTRVFLGTQSGRVFKVDQAQSNNPSVTEIGSDSLPTANISSIAIGGSDNNLLLTFSNYGVESVWKTNDGGSTWTNIEGNLPDMPIRWGLLHPDNPNEALLATEIGVWRSTDISTENVSWTPATNGLANVRVDMIQMRNSDNTVLAGTHGRGFFTTTWEAAEQSVHPLEQGFQFVSTNIEPGNADMISILDPLLDGSLDFVRNSNGAMVRQIGGEWINNIGDWQTTEGYLFHMNNSDDFTISGDRIDVQTPISLDAGYQFVSYLPENAMDAMVAFDGIIGDQLDFIRNSDGNTLTKIGPEWVNNIGDAIPGEGYLIHMNAPGELVYPESGEKSQHNNHSDPVHFVFEGGDPSDFVYTIYLPPVDVEIEDEVAAFCNGKMVGSTVIESDDTLGNDLAAFRTLTSGPGYEAGEEIVLKIWDKSEDKEYDTQLTFINPFGDAYMGPGYPSTDGEYSIIEAYRWDVGVKENKEVLVNFYPNPARDYVTIELPGEFSDPDLRVLDQTGKLMLNRTLNASGKHRIDVQGLKPGIYLLHLITNEWEWSEKLIVRK
ncbi:MAG: T9SS type A sorting domain-containing protein [Bacteroidales bacterium]|nr:T9SS type A sorting domain-containing protein [Bacteroidales bacterium]